LRAYLQRSVVAFDWVELASDNDCQIRLGLPKLKNARLPGAMPVTFIHRDLTGTA
jgi:hypothetical protein